MLIMKTIIDEVHRYKSTFNQFTFLPLKSSAYTDSTVKLNISNSNLLISAGIQTSRKGEKPHVEFESRNSGLVVRGQ